MKIVVGNLEKTNSEIVIDIDKVGIRPVTTLEMKYGYKPDLYILYRNDQYWPILCRDSEAAWTHYNAAIKAGKCQYFGIELDGKQFCYDADKNQFVLDAVINTNEKRYRVEYCINDERGFVHCAIFAEAKAKADEEYGKVYSMDGQLLYMKAEPDEYWGEM